ncbi:MAG: NAD(P)/FAD-dependent oxidoreductase [Phototrophicaceae bacterium]
MRNIPSDKAYDVAIIGSGFAGTTLASILARQGLQVVVFEAKEHPKFSIGESMILETSETMRTLAEFYDVPELAYFSSENFADYIGTSHGVKRHFSYLHHTMNQDQHDRQRTLQAVIPKEPHGHELHLFRQDSDALMLATAIRYGATVHQNTPITEIAIDPDGITIHTHKNEHVQANYVVDASGFRSPIAQKLDLRVYDQQTQSRAIFTHMIDVANFHDISASREAYAIPFSLDEGTLHHVFDGGWLWIIPFNNHSRSTNHTISVGLLLDPRKYPVRDDLTPEAEFFSFIDQYPAMAAQFKDAKAIRGWVRTQRIQYGSKQIVGDRWALLGHAAGFIDPLYSKGLYNSLTAVSMLSHLLLKAQKTGDFSADAFAPLATVTQNYLSMNDRLVANSYRAFKHPDLWQVYSVVWLLGAYTELVKLMSMRSHHQDDHDAYYQELCGLQLAGGGFAGYFRIAHAIDEMMQTLDLDNENDVQHVVRQASTLLRDLDWIPDPFIAVLDGAVTLPRTKLRLSLLHPKNGFLRTGDYRRHFFGDANMLDVIQEFITEKMHYSQTALRKRRTQ